MERLSKIILLLCCLIAACAGTGETTAPSQRTMDRESRTGSNIPRRDFNDTSATRGDTRDNGVRE